MPETDLTVGQAAARAGISQDAIKELVRGGILPAYYIGNEKRAYRIRPKDADMAMAYLRDLIECGKPKRWVCSPCGVRQALKELGASEELIASGSDCFIDRIKLWDERYKL